MPFTRYFRRAAFTLACLSLFPAGIGIPLGLVLYWSVPGKPVRSSQLLVEGLVAVAACALISFAI